MASVYSVSSFDKINPDHPFFSPVLHEKTLVMVDVDETLLFPKDPILREFYRREFRQIEREIGGLTVEPTFTVPYICVEECSVQWVRRLRERGIHVIAFTAAGGRLPPPHGDLVHNWRKKQLQELGFEFSDLTTEIELDKEQNPERSDVPLWKEGILYSAGRSKGKVFAEYIEHLQKIGKIFSQVVFIDDQHQNLRDVDEEAKKLGMNYMGLFYTAALSSPGTLQIEIARRQLEHFQLTLEWLSAEDAAEQIAF